MRRCFQILGVLLLAAGVSGCVVGRDHRAPVAALAPTFRLDTASLTNDPDTRWWRFYRSALIDELLDRGLSQSLLVQQALQRVVEARARLDSISASGIGGDGRLTAEAASGDAVRERFNRRNVLQAGLAASAAWQTDLFGQLRRQRDAAAATLDIAAIDVRAAQMQFVSELVDAVIDALAFREGGVVARQNLASQQRLVASLRQRLAQGESTALAVARAEALMSATAAQVPAFEAGYQNALGRLSVLLDEPAEGLDERLRRAPGLTLPMVAADVGRPADLLRRRPDIRRAERALAVATFEAGAVEAQLYPSITLRGSINLTDLALNVATAGRFGAGIGPQITVPLLDLPRLTANVQAARSVIESRHLEWRSAVATAVSEVDTAMARLRATRQSVARLQSAVAANEQAARLVQSAFDLGAATHSEVIDVERSLAETRQQLVSGRQQVAKAFAQLHVALGAGSEVWLEPGRPRYRPFQAPARMPALASGAGEGVPERPMSD